MRERRKHMARTFPPLFVSLSFSLFLSLYLSPLPLLVLFLYTRVPTRSDYREGRVKRPKENERVFAVRRTLPPPMHRSFPSRRRLCLSSAEQQVLRRTPLFPCTRERERRSVPPLRSPLTALAAFPSPYPCSLSLSLSRKRRRSPPASSSAMGARR